MGSGLHLGGFAIKLCISALGIPRSLSRRLPNTAPDCCKQLRGFLFLHSRFLRRHHTRRLESLRIGTAPYLIHLSERENRQRDITPDTPHWSIGRELGSLSPTRIPTRKNRLERYRLVFMGRFRPHTPGLFSARYGLTTCNESGETRSRTDRASPRTLAG